MNFIKNIMVFSLSSFMSMHAMNVDEHNVYEYIETHKDSPKELAQLLVDMPKWEKPDLGAAKKILGCISADDLGNSFDPLGRAALIIAARHDNADYVKLLLDFGADIEIKDHLDTETALMGAAFFGNDKTIKLLLQAGANPNATNRFNETALIWAADHAYISAVKLLLAADADIFHKDNKGKTALLYAKRALSNWNINNEYKERYDEIVMLLEKKQKDLELANKSTDRINAFITANTSSAAINQLTSLQRH